MSEKINYHEAIDLSVDQIHSRLGELALNKSEMTPRQQKAAELETDCLIFELSCRENEDGRDTLPTSA